MINYILLAVSSLFMALQFTVTKIYQKNTGISLRNSLFYSGTLGLVTAVIFFIKNGFTLDISSFSVIMATSFAILLVIYTAIGFIIMEKANVAVYTVFLMTGGMLVPYIWGLIFRHEHFSLIWTFIVMLIAVFIFLSNKRDGMIKVNVLPLCILVFVINGFVSVISKEHQISALAVDTTSFVIITGLAKAYVAFPVLLFTKKDKSKIKMQKKNILWIFLSALFTGTASFLQLLAAVNVPATIVFPATTAGSMIFTAIFNKLLMARTVKQK